MASLPLTLISRPDLLVNDLAGLIVFARSRPGGLTFVTSGTGTLLHLWGGMIARRENSRMKHVPYRIAAQNPSDLSAGRLKAFATSSLNPLPGLLLPGLPHPGLPHPGLPHPSL